MANHSNDGDKREGKPHNYNGDGEGKDSPDSLIAFHAKGGYRHATDLDEM